MKHLFWDMLDALPQEPCEWNSGKPANKFWADENMMMCKDEAALNAVADLLETVGLDVVTGYYDLEDDVAAGTVDRYSGYYYLSL